jgi:hypothetical protein
MRAILNIIAATSMAILSVAPVCGADVPVAKVRQIGGSIAPTTAQYARIGTPARPVSDSRAATADDEALCMGTDPSACPAPRMDATHTAFCDVEDVGFAACLASYAPAVVNHAAPARQVFTVTVRNGEGTMRTVTVLLTGAQTARDAAAMALQGTSGETVVAVN